MNSFYIIVLYLPFAVCLKIIRLLRKAILMKSRKDIRNQQYYFHLYYHCLTYRKLLKVIQGRFPELLHFYDMILCCVSVHLQKERTSIEGIQILENSSRDSMLLFSRKRDLRKVNSMFLMSVTIVFFLLSPSLKYLYLG